MTDVCGMRNLLVIMVFMMLTACADFNEASRKGGGVYHRVKKGETLARIAQAYQISTRALAKANGIQGVEAVEAGRALFIPGAGRIIDDLSAVKVSEMGKSPAAQPVRPPFGHLRKEGEMKRPLVGDAAANKPALKDRPLPPERPAPPPALAHKVDKTIFPAKLAPVPLPEADKVVKPLAVVPPVTSSQEERPFFWPVSGKVVSRFGRQGNGMFNNGIKIRVPENATVVAAAAGTVIYSAFLKDYGETIIIKHREEYATVYAHLGRRLVKCDAELKRGDKIAVVTRREASEEPFLHFEIRHKNKARNPLLFLP